MAKNATPKAETKERRKARTIEEQIAELQAKANERAAKAKAKAEAELTKAVLVRDNARKRLDKAEAKVADLRAAAGIEPDEEHEDDEPVED